MSSSRYTVGAQHHFDAAHRLPSHPGKCSHLHGHRWLVQVEIEGDLDGAGMVMDFGDVKGRLKALLDEHYDHATLAWEGDEDMVDFLLQQQFRHLVLPCEPTAENLAAILFGQLEGDLPGLVSVTVWETPTNKATAYGGR